ncbi:MAG: radical SAM protein [Magnetovibrio sp.]|nr:radical SAM protein [Magnetovibrio sp.]
MKIGCVYTVETYNSIEQPLSAATEIPFGLSIIATVLKEAGHEVELFVITPDTPIDDYVGDYLRREGPQLFCFSAVSTQYWQVKKVAAHVKSIDANVFCVLGGHHSSLNSQEVIDEGFFDAICVGEGERAVTDLADALARRDPDDLAIPPALDIANLWFRNAADGAVHKNPTAPFREDIDALPYIDRELWDKFTARPDDYPAVLLGRGCPFKCTYCSNHAMEKLSGGHYVRFRSPENIVGELQYIRRIHPGVDRVYLEVETFGANRKASYAVFDALAAYNAGLERPIRFGVNMALTSNYMMNPERRVELFEKAKAANILTINIGLESGSERLRKLMHRPKYSNDELIEFSRDAGEYGIRIVFFVLLGLPGETLEDYFETIRVARAAQPHLCYVSIFFPYLGTDLAATAIEMGLIDRSTLSPRGERSIAQLDLPGFSKRRIRFEYVIFAWRVYRGHWSKMKVAAHVAYAFLKAFPRFYSAYLYVRNNMDFVMRIANRYGRVESREMRKVATTVGTREDVIRE